MATHKIFKKLGKMAALLIALLILAELAGCGPTAKYAQEWEAPEEYTRPMRLASMANATEIAEAETAKAAAPEKADTTADAAEAEADEPVLMQLLGEQKMAQFQNDDEILSYVDFVVGKGMGAKLDEAMAMVAAWGTGKSGLNWAEYKSAVRAELEILGLLAQYLESRGELDEKSVTTLDGLVLKNASARYITDAEANYIVSLYGGSYFPAARHPQVIQ